MKNIYLSIGVAAALAGSMSVTWAASASGPGAKVTILEPADGAVVSSPVTIKFGAENVEIAPAGTDKANSGHHHLLVDAADTPAAGLPIAKDDHHQHFGKAQTETSITLAPGQHTLQLLLGDKDHVPHDPAVMSKKITVTVK